MDIILIEDSKPFSFKWFLPPHAALKAEGEKCLTANARAVKCPFFDEE